ncbi:hypothetical protein BGZ47_003095, partial [Haplosporangium gracile]
MLIQEWTQWLLHLNRSKYERVRRAAISAPLLTEAHLDEYYTSKLLKKRRLTAIESSIEQVTAADSEVTEFLTKEFGKVRGADSLRNDLQNKNTSPNLSVNEDSVSSSSTLVLSPRSAGKRTAARIPQISSKKKSRITITRNECIGTKEGLDSDETIDERDDTTYETVVDGPKVTKSAGVEDKSAACGNDSDDQDDDQGEETVEDLIQELQELEKESEPDFHPLIRALYYAARGEPFKKPQHKPLLSDCQSFLYDYVWDRLDTFLGLQTIEKKDVFVAISGIVDLDVHKDFPQRAALMLECRAAVDLQYPKIRGHLQNYRKFVDDNDGLKEARLGELMKQLKEDMSRVEDDSDEMVTIEILRILAKQSLPDKYERVKSTETSTLYVWFSIWKLLFALSAVDVQIGETMLKEAQQDQLAVRKVVGARAAKGAAGASGRRLDFRLVASIRKGRNFLPFTLCNNEHKAPDTIASDIKIQHRKNMRLNKSIAVNGWIPRESSTMFLDVIGLDGYWNIITPHSDVILSCQVQKEPLVLPANAFEMGTFLCGDGIERLLGYR